MAAHSPEKLKLLNKLQESINILQAQFLSA